jgi:hypothetical protein
MSAIFGTAFAKGFIDKGCVIFAGYMRLIILPG